jgi:hypothetical protein
MTIKDQLHRLVDELPECELLAAHRYLVYLRNVGSDPVLRAFLEAPIDDEHETEEERAAVQEAREELARSEGVPWDEARARLLGADEPAA